MCYTYSDLKADTWSFRVGSSSGAQTSSLRYIR